jgi:hypothetical protein
VRPGNCGCIRQAPPGSQVATDAVGAVISTVFAWLIGAGIGPAAVAVPVNWAAEALAGAAHRWFRRLRRSDDLSRLVSAASGLSADLNHDEFGAVRRLLEDERTWSIAGRGTVEDLAIRIASCLPPRDGRTREDSYAAALVIARGLLEFAVADLDPKLFQQLLLARLQRMEIGQASALDRALFDLHADLIAHFADIMAQFRRVLDRLPPGCAGRGEVAVYLTTLIDWLSRDPWPQHRRFGGAVLAPAAIERELRVSVARVREEDLDADDLAGAYDLADADDLAEECQRLVVLGGPGSGKTWLARRSARLCAQRALDALGAGATLGEVELPLYTTCSRLFTADGDIRTAVVSSALSQIGDMGGSRISAAVGMLFAERNEPTLLVIDSLDEARGSDERLRQADTLPWRIVLTSRPTSWDGQLDIKADVTSHWVGELQPLSYPNDVDPFIRSWFVHQPEQGAALAAQIAQNPNLQRSATVPLMLAMYCIIADGAEPLPEFRRDLYDKVLRCLLTGRWRQSSIAIGGEPDVGLCLRQLTEWAWAGVSSDPVSGIGAWADDVPTGPVRIDQPARDALDHIAVPLGPPDIYTEETSRRFIHRSIREHLIAGSVAALPVQDAAEILIPHLWFDPDWEYAAAAAIAGHPHRNDLLRSLICQVGGSGQDAGEIDVIDVGGEFRALLSRVASESRESDWQADLAKMIGQARIDLAASTRPGDLSTAPHWPASNGIARRELIEGLRPDYFVPDTLAEEFTSALMRLDPVEEDRRNALNALIRRLSRDRMEFYLDPRVSIARAMTAVARTADERQQAREAILRVICDSSNYSSLFDMVDVPANLLVKLAETPEERKSAREELLGFLAGPGRRHLSEPLTEAVVGLAITANEKRETRAALLSMMRDMFGDLSGDPITEVAFTRRWGRIRLREMLAELMAALILLDLTADDKRQARELLLRITRHFDPESLAGALELLDATAEDKRRARETLLSMLPSQDDGKEIEEMARALLDLDPTATDTRQACDLSLSILCDQTYDCADLEAMARTVGLLGATVEDKRRARETLLSMLPSRDDGKEIEEMARALIQLDPSADERQQARETLLRTLLVHPTGNAATEMAAALTRLDPTTRDRQQARDALLKIMSVQDKPLSLSRLAEAVVQLSITADERRQTCDGLLGAIHACQGDQAAAPIAGALIQLDPSDDQRRQAREILLGILAIPPNDERTAIDSAKEVAGLAVTADERRQTLNALVDILASLYDSYDEKITQAYSDKLSAIDCQDFERATALRDIEKQLRARKKWKEEHGERILGYFAAATAALAITADDRQQARHALLRIRPPLEDMRPSGEMMDVLVKLKITVQDLSYLRKWSFQSNSRLLAEARRNSASGEWLAAIPSLPAFPSYMFSRG